MANVCSFHLSVSGKKPEVEKFIKLLKFDPVYGYSRFGLVYSFEVQDWETGNDTDRPGMYVMGGEGKCPYSVRYAMRDDLEYVTLEMISQRLGLHIEVDSVEEDAGFEEHFVVDDGVVLRDECYEIEEELDDSLDANGYIDSVIFKAEEVAGHIPVKDGFSVDFVKG